MRVRERAVGAKKKPASPSILAWISQANAVVKPAKAGQTVPVALTFIRGFDSLLAETKMPHGANSLARLLKVLSVGTRVRIVQLLKGRALCVNALAARLDVTQGAVSQHLRVMRDAGLVIDEKRGYYVHYRLNEETLAIWREEIEKLLSPTAGAYGHAKGVRKCAVRMRRSQAATNRRT